MTSQNGALGILTESNVDVPMRDGVILRANLWLPDAPGEFPGIVIRTPYGKASAGYERVVRAGYAVLCQDTRGRYDSDGEFTVFTTRTTDPEDGYDTVEWMADQPWCNGRIGTMGASYVGWTQWMTARTRPPHLVATCARSIPLELTNVDWWGAFRPGRRLQWWLTTMAPDLRRRAGWPPPHTPAEAREIWNEIEQGRWIHMLPYVDIAQYLPPPLDSHVRDWLLHPARRAWRFDEAHAEIDVPNLDFTGWYDHCSSIGHLPGMQQNARTETARKQTKVVIGPWSHATMGKRECLGIDFGPEAALDTRDLEIRWFDYWLKGVQNGTDQEPPVRYFVMGTGKWKTAASWPPPGLTPHTLYLHADTTEEEALADALPGKASTRSYSYDPKDPLPTLWSRSLMAGASERNRLDYRQDVLRYRTEPLEADLEIAGSPELVLYASSSAVDTDFFVWLSDESPDGKAIEICYGMVRARHRNGYDQEDFLTPGETTEFRIILGPTACCFRSGHRLRIDISSSDFPNFERNHNTGKNDLIDCDFRVAHQRLHHGPDAPSRLVLGIA